MSVDKSKNAPVIGNDFVRLTLGPLLMITQTPILACLFWLVTVYYDGSVLRFIGEFNLDTVLHQFPRPSWMAFKILAAFTIMQYTLLVVLPGPKYKGSPSPAGYEPTYKLNGVMSYVVTLVSLYVAVYHLRLFSPTLVYDHMGEIIITVNILAFILVWLLYFKGVYAPEHPQDVKFHSVLWDFWHGVELYPTFAGVPFKQLVNCRLGMMGWAVLIFAFAAKQYETYGYVANSMIVSNTIQSVYIIKFYWWEGGYFRSIDIMHDRFGFMICWGCLTWITSLYTLASFWLTLHPFEYSREVAVLMLALGVLMVWINYSADEQRQRVRDLNGNTNVWGKRAETITAQYKNDKGETHKNLLLCSGWWGVARHFQYVPEILLSVMWTVPAGFTHILPYFYVIFLTILLTDRSGRDEVRCSTKYQGDWKKYCAKVPYRMIPYLF